MNRLRELDIVEQQAELPRERVSPAAWFLLAVLVIAYICSTLDRFVISLLIEPIKHALGLSDTEISLLQGLAFSLIFALATLPVGYLVDRVNRTRLIAVGVAFWSLMNSLCGLSASFPHMFLARAGVGVGEAALSPAAYSLISDAFPKHRYGLALGIFAAGGSVGSGLSMLIGGFVIAAIMQFGVIAVPLIGTLQPWQTSFFVVSAPGFLIAFMMLWFREPSHNTRTPGLSEVQDKTILWRFLRKQRRTLVLHHLAVGITTMAIVGALSWIAPLFMRVHGWSVSEAGLGAGLAILFGSTIGLLGGGALSDIAMKRGPHWRLIVCACSTFLAAGFALSYPLVSSPILAIILYGCGAMFSIVPSGVANAALQFITPPSIRGKISSYYLFTIGILNMIGPTLIAVVADRFFPFHDGIRYALAIVLPSCLILATILFALTARIYRYEEIGEEPAIA
jgi:MFS family permease